MSKYRVQEESSSFNKDRTFWKVYQKDSWFESWWFVNLFDTFEDAEAFVKKRIRMAKFVKYYE